MALDSRDAAYLLDIVEAGARIARYVAGKTFSDYRKDDLLRDAVERNVMVVGEAAKKLSKSFQGHHPEVRWGNVVALRNVLAHAYGGVDEAEMWKIATVHIPDLVAKLQPFIPPPPETT